MDLRIQLLKENSKGNALFIADFIGNNPVLFRKLLDLFLYSDYRVSQRAAMVFACCTDRFPELMNGHFEEVTTCLTQSSSDAVKRNILRVFQNIFIPEEHHLTLINFCFSLINNRKEAIAIRVFSMSVLLNLCTEEPDLLKELKLCIEQQLMSNKSPGILSRGRKVIGKINSLL